jgi:hypothetical protein
MAPCSTPDEAQTFQISRRQLFSHLRRRASAGKAPDPEGRTRQRQAARDRRQRWSPNRRSRPVRRWPRAIHQNARSGSAGTVSQPTQDWRQSGYRVLHDRGAVTVGNEAPVWASPTKPKGRMTTRSRHRLITGVLVNLTRHYSKLFSAGWTSIRHWAWLSSTGQPSSGKSASEEAGNRFRDEPPERGPASRRRWPRARS